MRRARHWLCACALFTSSVAASSAATEEPNGWCAPDLEHVGEATCFWLAPKPPPPSITVAQPIPGQNAREEPRTLVIFLHGLTGDGSTWQWDRQRMYVRLAKQHNFSALMPRGRKGIGPGRDPDVWAWPNSQRAQSEVEAEVLADLAAAREALEKRSGKFDRVFVFGFSAGAYYATSLMIRERLEADGFAAFAGGSGNEYEKLLAKRVKRRTPMFVGYGTRDPDRKRQQALVKMLEELDWPHRVMPARVGHTVTTAQLEGALEFLARPNTP